MCELTLFLCISFCRSLDIVKKVSKKNWYCTFVLHIFYYENTDVNPYLCVTPYFFLSLCLSVNGYVGWQLWKKGKKEVTNALVYKLMLIVCFVIFPRDAKSEMVYFINILLVLTIQVTNFFLFFTYFVLFYI